MGSNPIFPKREESMLEDWNVRIIQNGEKVEDVLYNIYIPTSIVFDENEGLFLSSDYKTAVNETERDYRSPLFPIRNYHIKNQNYFSVSVNLETYIKMLKGEKPFPNSLSREKRLKHNILLNSLVQDVSEVKELIEENYK